MSDLGREWAAEVSALLAALREARDLAEGLELGFASDLDDIYYAASLYAKGVPRV